MAQLTKVPVTLKVVGPAERRPAVAGSQRKMKLHVHSRLRDTTDSQNPTNAVKYFRTLLRLKFYWTTWEDQPYLYP